MPERVPTLEDELAALKREIQRADKNAIDFSKRHFNGLQEKAIVFCLSRASDLAKGAIAATVARLPESVYVLARGLFEVFIQIYWISFSANNAEQFAQAYPNDLKRNAKGNLAKGYAAVYDHEAKVDRTQEILSDPDWQKIPMLRFDKMASEADIEKLYTMIYGSLSMHSHGYTFGIDDELSDEEALDGAIALSASVLEGINEVASRWITARQQISSDEMYDILLMTQYKPKPQH